MKIAAFLFLMLTSYLSFLLCGCGASDYYHQKAVNISKSLQESVEAEKQLDSMEKVVEITSSTNVTLAKINNDTITIKEKAAVLIEPDFIQMNKRIKQVGEEYFRAGMDDYLYYMNISAEYLKKQNIKIVQITGKKLIRFIKKGNATVLMNTDTLPSLWNVYLFTPQKNPYEADMIAIDEDYPKYFRND